jgi:DNA repair exonuclease SbcCD ATPase subunit
MDQALVSRLGKVHAVVSSIDQRLQYETAAISRLQSRIKQLEDEKGALVKAVGVLDRVVQIVSANGIGKIEGIVSDGLRRVFGNDQLGLYIEKKETARGNSYRLLIRKGDIIGNPMDSFGGGVQNVAAFLLRVILIKRFKLAPFLALDEQFSNVSPEFQPRVAKLLKTLAGMGFTILAVSHQPTITRGADYVYTVTVHCPKCGSDLTPQFKALDDDEDFTVVCPMCQITPKTVLPHMNKVQ